MIYCKCTARVYSNAVQNSVISHMSKLFQQCTLDIVVLYKVQYSLCIHVSVNYFGHKKICMMLVRITNNRYCCTV